MSGGHFNYVNEQVALEMRDSWADPVLNELFRDLFDYHNYGSRDGGLAQMLDFMLSGDIGEDAYYERVKEFKDKWFGNPDVCKDATKAYIDKEIENLREHLYSVCQIEVAEDE